MNRFTNFTPQQYVESFVETPTMDFPFQEAMMIEGIKEKRNNELANTLAELSAGDPQAGYLTKDLRNQYMADKEKSIGELQVKMLDSNIPFNTRKQELMKESIRLKNDPRLRTIREDFELSPHITKGMLEDGYGTSRFYAGLNPQIIKDVTEGRITSIDPSTYDGIIDPGKMAAMKSTLDLVTPDIIQGYELVTNADGTKEYKNKETNKSLDMNTFMDRTQSSRDAMTNEDGSINLHEGLTPETKMFIKANMYRKAQTGEKYTMEDYTKDMKDVASLMLHINKSEDVSGMGSNKSSGKKGNENSGILGGSMITTTYTPPEEDNKIETVSAAQKTTGIVQDGTNHFVKVDDGKGNVTNFNMNNVTSSDFETRKAASSELKNAIYEREKNEYMKGIVEKEHRGVKILLKDGQPITQEQINTEVINNSNDRYIQSLKYAKALHDTEIELLDNVSQKDLELTTEEKNIVKNWKPTPKGMQVGNSDIPDFSGGETRPYLKGFTAIDGKWIPNRMVGKYNVYKKTLDKNVKESFANTEISTKGIVLINKENWNGIGDIPDAHKNLRSGINAIVKSQSSGFSGNGKNYESFWKGDGTEGQHITSLKLAGVDDYGDFRGGSFNPNQIVWDPTTRNGTNGRWIARGSFSGTKKDGDKITDIVSEPIDLDVTQYMRDNILTSGENQSVLVTDMALDIVSNTPKGLGGVAPTGLTPEEEKKYGEIYVNRNLDNTYSIYGNTVSNGKIVSIETPEFIQNLGEEYGITTNKNLNQSTAIDLLGRMIHTRFKDSQKGESTPEQQVYESLPVSEERLPSLQDAFQAIENNESATYGGYDAMNTGGGADGKTAYNPSTGVETFKIPLTKMTVGKIKNLQSSDGKKKELHAAGKFQIIPETFKVVAERLGLKDTDLFNEETQTKMGNYLFEETVNNAANDIMSDDGYTLTPKELYNRLFNTGKILEDSKKPTGWMVHQWRGLENAKGEEKQAILTAAIKYLKEVKEYSI